VNIKSAPTQNSGQSLARIASWIAFYTNRRPHQGLGYKTPMSVWRLGTTDALGAGAADMTLRLDNAGALPICPQPQQQQTLAA
jgi:putative transposase